MLKRLLAGLLLTLALFAALSACGGPASSNSGNGPTASNEVHMEEDNFKQASIMLQKGQSLVLVNDSGVPHFIANGTWKGGSPDTQKETGAPTVDNVQISGNATQSIGPFNVVGTFHLFCTIHPGMNLTVVVQ